MKKFIVFICACFLTIFLSEVRAGELENAMKLVDNSLVLVRHTCVFTATLKLGGETRLVINEILSGIGTGFFVDKPQKTPSHFNIFSAGHVVDCSIRWYVKRLDEIVPYGSNSLELKGGSLRTDIKYKGVWYPATVEELKFGGAYPDYASLLTAVLPESINPYLIPYSIKNGEYGVGSKVVFRGFMGIGGDSEFNGADHGMMIMMDEAVIQYMGNNFFRISLSAHPGMSGSPILYLKYGKYYAIGIVSAGNNFQSAIITDLGFLNIDSKTAPN